MKPKPKRPQGRLSQLSKVMRLRRRHLGQWRAEVNAPNVTVTRFSLEDAEWRDGV